MLNEFFFDLTIFQPIDWFNLNKNVFRLKQVSNIPASDCMYCKILQSFQCKLCVLNVGISSVLPLISIIMNMYMNVRKIGRISTDLQLAISDGIRVKTSMIREKEREVLNFN